ncbi:hypothetical protein EVA_18429 [gut metagenome]|uniref:Uncharacterized protein n=1 Tax=gut metagenome TaxID=749906 RepID=J9C0W6_9ZZZZ
MLVVRIGITRLGCIPHYLIGLFSIPTNQCTSSGSGNHLVTVE